MRHLYFIWILISILFSSTIIGKGQQRAEPDAKEKIKSLQIAYLAKRLDLTTEEAEKFLPIYNNYSHEVEELIAERRLKNKQKEHLSNDDNAAREAMDKELNYEKKMLDIKTRYTREFMKVLPPRKAGGVFKSEREFRSLMINQLRERQNSRMKDYKRNRP
jgi:hypothetical protein